MSDPDPRRLTILHLDSGREMRGGQWQVLRLARGLRTLGHHNLVAARSQSPLFDRLTAEGFQCVSLAWHAIYRALKRCDLVHAHDARSHTLAAIVAACPIVVSRRVAFPISRTIASHWKYSRPESFSAVSQAVALELSAAAVPARKIAVIYDGVPLLPLSWQCGGPLVIPEFKDENKLTELAIAAAQRAHVPFIRSSNLERDLKGAAAMLYLTSAEGLGSGALIAMSAGVPVIASSVGGLPEIVTPGQTGLLVANHLSSAEHAISLLHSSPGLLAAMSARCRQVVAQRFSETRMVSDTLNLYKRVVNAC